MKLHSKKLGIYGIVVTIAGSLLLFGQRRLDYAGWIPHRQVTATWSPVDQPWAVGEYLDCTANPMPPLTDPRRNSPGIDSLGCARNWERERGEENLSKREVQVTYWGRISIPYPESAELYKKIMTTPNSAHYYDWPFRWRCRRNETSLTCLAVN
jgi:hypothetical protein